MPVSTGILATEYELAGEVLSFGQLSERFGAATMQKVLAGSGIRDRRVAPPGVCGSDLAFAAAERLLRRAGADRSAIDLLIFCTQSPDYLLPSTACVLHERLGLSRRCAAFDLNLGCSQYVYALAVAHGMIASGCASRALVLTGDTMSRTVHPMDRSVVPLMGDAGSASLVCEMNPGEGFLGFELGTDGTGHRYLMIPAGGFRHPSSPETRAEITDAEGNVRTTEHLQMNGAAIFHFAISVVPPTIERLLGRLSLRREDVDLFLFHQANRYMLDYLFRKLKIPPEKTHVFLEEIGNTSGSTIPVVLTHAWRAGKIRPGMLILAIGFGVGLSWAATVMRWPAGAIAPPPEAYAGVSQVHDAI
jgi:3-oxoacyl-[acyl-carrier-protein] synthase III